MAKKKANKQNSGKIRPSQPSEPQSAPANSPSGASSGNGLYALRETIESIVIAFVLAFLFRTFEAEAFVIPTGSMSPALQGQHKDVDCSECGYRFRTTASSEGDDRQRSLAQMNNPNLNLAERHTWEIRAKDTEVVAGQCPMCRQTMVMRPDLPSGVPAFVNQTDITHQTSYPGDRILVNKFCYNDRDPDRWDVIVFKFPGNSEMNYIKRLVGLSNETLRIFQGDIFIRDDSQAGDFRLERKPADKVKAMLQPVHDTDHDPSILYSAGWPLRWQATSPSGWEVKTEAGPQTVKQQFLAKPSATDSEVAWLRYQNFVAQDQDWAVARQFQTTGEHGSRSKEQWLADAKPELIRDFNPYNAVRLRGQVNASGWSMPDERYHSHWVSDLAVRCHVVVQQAAGELYLDLVEAGQHFTCRIDLATGVASLEVAGFQQFSATAPTSINQAGSYELLFANIDDQLLLWVDGKLIPLATESDGLPYDAPIVFAGRENIYPQTSENDLGDLAPAGIGATGATLQLDRLEVLRDIYYIATNTASNFSDYPSYKYSTKTPDGKTRLPGLTNLRQLFVKPSAWPRFGKREPIDFEIQAQQLFVMGDNSPASQDCRLWATPNRDGSYPGGSYLDRQLLIGKAICVFWPHSWGGIGPLPGFPNFEDMRLVR